MRKNLLIAAALFMLFFFGCGTEADTPDNDMINDNDISTPDKDTGTDKDTGEPADNDIAADSEVSVDDDEDIPDNDISDDGKELVIEQIYLPGMNMGESILIIGPDGTSVLIDTANDGHGPQLFEAIERRVGKRELDWVILTHYHNDHIGGFDNLFVSSVSNGNNPVKINKGIISRGFADIGADMINVSDFLEMCEALEGSLKSKHIPLCHSSGFSCGSNSGVPWAAADCEGLLAGDLSQPSGGKQMLSYIPLGENAKLYLYHADGWLAQESGVQSSEAAGLSIGWGETDPENARSLGGMIRWGDFTYTFDGDTTSNPNIEGFIAARGEDVVIEDSAPLLPHGKNDVSHLSHHGLPTSTSQAWVDWLFPADSQTRNAVVGTTAIYITSPSQDVLNRLDPRIGAGFVWTTVLGLTYGSSPKLKVANGAVIVRAFHQGAAYEVWTRANGQDTPPAGFASTK